MRSASISEAAFNRAFKREYGDAAGDLAAAASRSRREDARAKLSDWACPQQVVRYCTAKDGTRLAFSVVGEGPPLVKAANWLNHIEHDWKSPRLAPLARTSSRDGHTLIRYDERANGLSDWDTPEISFDAFVDDLECVVDCAGVEQFDLLGNQPGRGGGDRLCRAPPGAGAPAADLSAAMPRAGRRAAIRRRWRGARR